MAKSPPNGRARGPEAETAGQPLVAQLKQAKADMTKGQQEKFEEVYPQLEKYIEELIVGANNNFDVSSLSFSLLVPVSHSHLGVTVTGENIRSRIRRWATKNGLSITFVNRLVMQNPSNLNTVESSEVEKIRALPSRIISLCVDPRLQEGYQLWKFLRSQLTLRDQNAALRVRSGLPRQRLAEEAWVVTCSALTEAFPGGHSPCESECHKVTISWAVGDE